jgi:arylsulfatase A-like enzyme
MTSFMFGVGSCLCCWNLGNVREVREKDMKSKGKSKRCLTAIASALCCTLVAPQSAYSNDDGYTHRNHGRVKQPNVIIFMADDLGQDAVPLYNPDDSELVQTRRDLGNPFPENPPMPALAKLAEHGVTFKNGWAMPVCSTTRATRSTGKYASTTGVGQVIGQFTPRRGAADSRFDGVEFPPSILNPDDPRMLQRLAKKHGYNTYKFGKWHEVEVEFFEADNITFKNFDPLDLTDPVAAELATQGLDDVYRSGFDEFYGLLSGFYGGINGNGYAGGEVPFIDQPTGAKLDDGTTDAIHLIDSRSTRVTNGVPDARNPTTEFADSAMVGRAIQLIKEARDADKPYFIEYSALAPHFQYEVPPGPWDTTPPADYNGELGGWRTLDKDVHKEVIVQIIAAFNDLEAMNLTVDDIRNDLEAYKDLYPDVGTRAPGPPPNPSPVAVAQRRAAFKGLVSYMDVQMARLMEHVDWNNTYMIFVGDNGTQGGGPVFSVIEPPNDTNKSKASVYRNGREVPFVFAGPGKLNNVWRNDLVNVTDLYATVLNIIGTRQPKATRNSSYSFYRVLKGGKSKRRVNVSEQFPATATVGGRNPIGSGQPGPFGSGARAVGNDRFSLLAFNRIEANLFVCLPGSTALPEEDCLNEKTGIYEHVVDLEFYDLKADPFEDDALVLEEMSREQHKNFRRLCRNLNQISKKASYYQNGKVCNSNGEQLRDTEPVIQEELVSDSQV